MIETLIASLFTLNLSLLIIIIKPRRLNMNQKQEEDLRDYQEQQKGWEFKILRMANDGFRSPKSLKAACEDEAESGWILLEKLDDSRLRFRRLIKFRDQDHLSKLDPYRSNYGSAFSPRNLIGSIIFLLFMAAAVFLGFSFMQNIFKSLNTQNLQPSPKPPISSPKPPALPPKPLPPKP